MLVFVSVNYLLALATTVLLGWQLFRRPWLLVKPSVVVLVLYHGLLQWPSAFASQWIFDFLPRPWDAVVLVHGFVLGGASLSVWLHRRVAENLWWRPTVGDAGVPWISVAALAAPIVITIGVYLAFVPLPTTGLVAMSCSPEVLVAHPGATSVPATSPPSATSPRTPDPEIRAAVARAREESLKSTSTPIAYAYFFNAKALSLVLACLLTLWWLRQERKLAWSGPYLAAIATLAVGASLSGARAFGVYILLAALVTAFLDQRPRLRIGYPLLLSIAVVLVLPVWPAALSLFRECQELTLPRLAQYTASFVIDRLGSSPVPNAMYYLDFAQKHGLLSLDMLPAIAKLSGSSGINLPNLIQVIYYPTAPASGFANAGFPFVYYVYLGLGSTVVSVALLQALDLLLYIAQRISAPFSTAMVAAVLVNATVLTEAEFTTALVTHGIVPATAVVLVAAWLGARSRNRRSSPGGSVSLANRL